MSNCLSDVHLQEAADGRGTPADQQHLDRCAACRGRVEAIREAVAEFGRAMAATTIPSALEERVTRAVTRDSADRRRGATTLLAARGRKWTRPLWIPAAGALAAAAIVLVAVLPSLDSPSRLSAADILNRSIATLAPAGTELLEYDLSIAAPPSWPIESGTYRIEQVIEHEGAGRWRLSRFDADGTLLNGISENPGARQRHAYVRLDGQGYAFDFTIAPATEVPLAQLQRDCAAAAIRIIQSASDQIVTTVDDPAGKRYLITLPEGANATGAGAASLWELTGARVLVDATDYHVIEKSIRALYLGQPVGFDYRLKRRELRPSSQVPPHQFELPVDPAAIHIGAEGTMHPPRDVFAAVLRELARSRR